MKIINVTTREELDALYEESALTWEGLKTDEKNLNAVHDWLKEHGAIIADVEPTVHIIKGILMNTTYELTENKAYPSDLNIVSITGINQMAIALPKFLVGGRWFDDIVNNNAAAE